MSEFSRIKIGFIGGGNMAQAIIKGLLGAGHEPESLSVSEPDPATRERLASLFSAVHVQDDNLAVASASDVLVLAVKPQVMATVAQQLVVGENTLLISIAAGVTLQSLQRWLGDSGTVVRIMPNQPALVGMGVSGLACDSSVEAEAKAQADYIAAATGIAVWLDDESFMDAITAVSGSGPAYFYLLMETMAKCATDYGFDADTARRITVQTALGAAQLAAADSAELSELRKRVTSPGGTTAAALQAFSDGGFQQLVKAALNAARERSEQLGQDSEQN
ncbi:MAG: pyrroline-5-carboxylate reductase [Gammaproteobacteria bacterium]